MINLAMNIYIINISTVLCEVDHIILLFGKELVQRQLFAFTSLALLVTSRSTFVSGSLSLPVCGRGRGWPLGLGGWLSTGCGGSLYNVIRGKTR